MGLKVEEQVVSPWMQFLKEELFRLLNEEHADVPLGDEDTLAVLAWAAGTVAGQIECDRELGTRGKTQHILQHWYRRGFMEGVEYERLQALAVAEPAGHA